MTGNGSVRTGTGGVSLPEELVSGNQVSGNQLVHYFCRGHIGQTLITAVMVIGQLFVVQAEQTQDCRMQTGGLRSVFDRAIAKIVRCTISLTAPDSTACHPDTETIRVMVPAKSGFAIARFRRRCATEFSSPQYQCGVQQAALFQVCQQASDRALCLLTAELNGGVDLKDGRDARTRLRGPSVLQDGEWGFISHGTALTRGEEVEQVDSV